MPRVVNIFFGCRKPRNRIKLRTFGPVTEQQISWPIQLGVPMTGVLSDTQQATLTYGSPTDKKGKKAPIEKGSLVWKTSDPLTATILPGTEDPISGIVVAGDPGVCEVWPEADADLGSGVITIVGEKFGVQVTAGQASAIGSPVFGTPSEQITTQGPA